MLSHPPTSPPDTPIHTHIQAAKPALLLWCECPSVEGPAPFPVDTYQVHKQHRVRHHFRREWMEVLWPQGPFILAQQVTQALGMRWLPSAAHTVLWQLVTDSSSLPPAMGLRRAAPGLGIGLLRKGGGVGNFLPPFPPCPPWGIPALRPLTSHSWKPSPPTITFLSPKC